MEPKKTKALSGFHPAKGRGTDLGCGDHWAVGRRIEQRQLGCRVWCGVFFYPDDTVICPRAVRWPLDEVKVAVIVRRAAFGSDEAVCFLVANMQATRSARYSA